MDLRGALLPVVSLRRIFNLPQDEMEKTHRIVVVPLQDAGTGSKAAIGVLMDTVREVLRVPRSVVDPLPSFLAQSGRLAEVESVCRLDGGKRLVSILSAERLFAGNGLRSAIAAQLGETSTGSLDDREDAMADPSGDATGQDGWTSTEEQLVVFRVDEEEYCVNVDSVQEIIRVPEQLIRVPKALAFVEGLVNLRSTVLPVVDLRTRLGLPRVDREDRQRIVVLIIGGIRTGFIVDSVAEVMKLDRSMVEAAPGLSAEQASLISEVANLTEHKRMLLILQPEHLLATTEIDALTEATAA
jgi:purine-binding chemotaxis protein CheW